MPRHRRCPTISEFRLQLIERAAWLLDTELAAAQLSLVPFCRDYDACSQLQVDLKRALNLLNGRPADYERPHQAPMSGGR